MNLAEFQKRMDEMQVIAKKEALAWFLLKEIKRHEKDIVRAWEDIAKLRKQGINIPDYDKIDADSWIGA